MLTRGRFLVITLGLILLSNGAALLVAWDNQREILSSLNLSQHELSLRGNHYHLIWHYPKQGYGITREQFAAFSPSCAKRCRTQSVYAVLELDGPLHQAALSQASKPASVPMRSSPSRLYLAGIGLDAKVLRQTFADPAQYAIVKAQFRPSSTHDNQYYGSISLSHARVYAPKGVRPDAGPCALHATLNWGNHHIPWLKPWHCQ